MVVAILCSAMSSLSGLDMVTVLYTLLRSLTPERHIAASWRASLWKSLPASVSSLTDALI